MCINKHPEVSGCLLMTKDVKVFYIVYLFFLRAERAFDKCAERNSYLKLERCPFEIGTVPIISFGELKKRLLDCFLAAYSRPCVKIKEVKTTTNKRQSQFFLKKRLALK